MKTLQILVVLLITFTASAQKIKLKKGKVFVDNVEWLKYEGCKEFSDACSLMTLDGKEIVFINRIRVGSNKLFNEYGKPNYNEVSFLGTGKKIEIRKFDKKIIKILYNAGCINEDGTFNEEKLNTLVEKYGTAFSNN